MCPGKGSAAWQVPVDEEEEEAAAAAAQAAAAEEAMWERVARVGMRRVAALLLADVRGLSDLLARTQHPRAMLASAVDRLHEAADELNLPVSDAGWILALPLEVAGALQLPVPGSIDAARRIAGRLCGILPRASRYQMQICECWHPLVHMFCVYIEADDLLFRCAEMLLLTYESPRWRRWLRRMDHASDQPKVVRERLADAHERAGTAHSHLFNLVEFWHADGVARMDRPRALSSAEENLRAAVDLMDQALTAMRQMRDALEVQAYELMILARHHEDED